MSIWFTPEWRPPSSRGCKRDCCWTPYGHAQYITECACHPDVGGEYGNGTDGEG